MKYLMAGLIIISLGLVTEPHPPHFFFIKSISANHRILEAEKLKTAEDSRIIRSAPWVFSGNSSYHSDGKSRGYI